MPETIKFQTLEITVETNNDEVIYSFSGDMNESFEHSKIPRHSKNRVVLMLKDLKTFNSVGIREWIKFITDLSYADELVFRECSLAVIDQVNMVPKSLGAGVIESFYAPYYCECDIEENRLIVVKDNLEAISNFIAPNFDCNSCGEPMEFDALEQSYFQFLSDKSLSNAS